MADPLGSKIREDHDKLNRLFASIEAALRLLKRTPDATDCLEGIREDLSFAVEEMLEHFGLEEQVLFTKIRVGLPDLGDRIDALEADHEELCLKTQRLRELIPVAPGDPLDVNVALKVLSEATRLLAYHNVQEMEVFNSAVDRLAPPERAELLSELESH